MVAYYLDGKYKDLSAEFKGLREKGVPDIIGAGYLGLLDKTYFEVLQFISGNEKNNRINGLERKDGFYNQAIEIKDFLQKDILDFFNKVEGGNQSAFSGNGEIFESLLEGKVVEAKSMISKYFMGARSFLEVQSKGNSSTSEYAEKHLKKLEDYYDKFYSERFGKPEKKALNSTTKVYFLNNLKIYDEIKSVLEIVAENVKHNKYDLELTQDFVNIKKDVNNCKGKKAVDILDHAISSSLAAIEKHLLNYGGGRQDHIALEKIRDIQEKSQRRGGAVLSRPYMEVVKHADQGRQNSSDRSR